MGIKIVTSNDFIIAAYNVKEDKYVDVAYLALLDNIP
jgi:hypothetical protein